MALSFSSGTNPLACNPEAVITEKILIKLNAGGSTGGGSASNLSQGNGAPVAAPADPTSPAYYTDLQGGQTYVWNVSAQAWQ